MLYEPKHPASATPLIAAQLNMSFARRPACLGKRTVVSDTGIAAETSAAGFASQVTTATPASMGGSGPGT